MVNVKELRINKNKNELTVTFDDGFSNTLSSELLRVESPSAEVQGHGPNQKKTPSQKSRVVIEEIEPSHKENRLDPSSFWMLHSLAME